MMMMMKKEKKERKWMSPEHVSCAPGPPNEPAGRLKNQNTYPRVQEEEEESDEREEMNEPWTCVSCLGPRPMGPRGGRKTKTCTHESPSKRDPHHEHEHLAHIAMVSRHPHPIASGLVHLTFKLLLRTIHIPKRNIHDVSFFLLLTRMSLITLFYHSTGRGAPTPVSIMLFHWPIGHHICLCSHVSIMPFLFLSFNLGSQRALLLTVTHLCSTVYLRSHRSCYYLWPPTTNNTSSFSCVIVETWNPTFLLT